MAITLAAALADLGIDAGVALGFAISDETTPLAASTEKLNIRAPFAFIVTSVKASVRVASSSGPVTVDININGATMLSTKLTIDQSEESSSTAATPAVISSASIANDDEITFDIDAAGTGAMGLKVWLIGSKA
jgi:fructose-1-phosphate kinase PfkB-like protein